MAEEEGTRIIEQKYKELLTDFASKRPLNVSIHKTTHTTFVPFLAFSETKLYLPPSVLAIHLYIYKGY